MVSGNTAIGGGGVQMEGSGVIESSTISGNSANQSGSIVLSQGQNSLVQLLNSTVSDNSAAAICGIFLSGNPNVGTVDLEVMNSTIANNTGSPALFVDNSAANIAPLTGRVHPMPPMAAISELLNGRIKMAMGPRTAGSFSVTGLNSISLSRRNKNKKCIWPL